MDMERRIDQLEARLVVLERERVSAQLRVRRDRWMRMALLIVAAIAYMIYFQILSSSI